MPLVRLAAEVSAECLMWIVIVNLVGRLAVVSSPQSIAVIVSIDATLCHAKKAGHVLGDDRTAWLSCH